MSLARARRRYGILLPVIVSALLAACGGDDDDGPSAAAVAAPDSASTKWNQAATLDVTANDTVENGSASVSIAGAPQHGTAVVDGTRIVYTPETGWFGSDSFSYTLSVGGQSSTAEVQVAVAAELAVSGVVRDAPLPGATVVATVDGEELPPVTADAEGRYTLTIETADPAAFVSLKATGADAQSHVVLTSLVGEAAEVAAAAAEDGSVSDAALPAANVTHVSTAVAVLTQQALGRVPASSADLAAVQGRFTGTQTVEIAAAIKLVADGGVALPEGSADTLALVSSTEALQSFVTAQLAADPDAFAQAQADVLGDPALAAAPSLPTATEPRTLLLVQGEGASATSASRVTLNADGSAALVSDSVVAATWTASGNEIAIVYAHPLTATGYSTDPATGIQYQTSFSETGFVLRQLGSGTGNALASVQSQGTRTYLEGPREGQTEPTSGNWDSQTLVGTVGEFTSADVAPGTRWSGVLSPTWLPSHGTPVNQDTLRIVDATTAVFERSNAPATWVLADGRLTVTVQVPAGPYTWTYTRLFDGPRGEQRWLVDAGMNGAQEWTLEAAAWKADDGAGFSAASLTHRWESYINQGLTADKFFIGLEADGTAWQQSVPVVGEPYARSYGAWSITTDGQMLLDRGSQQRYWQPLGAAGQRIYVLERLVIPSSNYDQTRLNVYTIAD